MNFRSISFRLVVWYTSLLTGIFLLLGTLFYFGLQHFLQADMERGQLHRAHQIAVTLLEHLPVTGEAALVEEIKSLYAPEINDRFIRLCRADGTVVYVSGKPADGSFDPAEVPAFFPHPDADSTRKFSLAGGKTLLVVLVNYQVPKGEWYTVESGALLDPVEAMLNHLFIELALCLPLAVLIIAGGGWLLVHRALQPVAEITRAAEQITQLNTSERMPVAQTGDELENYHFPLIA